MRIKLFTICATCLKYGSLALQRTKIKHRVGRKEEMCRLPSAGLQGQSDLTQKKNASNFQTNLILNFWIFFSFRCVETNYSWKKEKQNKTKPSTARAKGDHVSFAGKCQLRRATELIWKRGGERVKAIVVLWVPSGFFEPRLWLEFIFFYVLFWAWHGLLGYDSA